jgi:hypothetical protein
VGEDVLADTLLLQLGKPLGVADTHGNGREDIRLRHSREVWHLERNQRCEKCKMTVGSVRETWHGDDGKRRISIDIVADLGDQRDRCAN